MRNRGGKRQYEGALYFILACIAIAVFSVSVARLAQPAEQARVQYTLSNLRSVIQIAELTATAAGAPERLTSLDRANPIELMGTPPAGYAGELAGVENTRPGRWYFDAANDELVYRLINAPSGQPAFLRFQLRYRQADKKGAGPGRLHLVERARPQRPDSMETQ